MVSDLVYLELILLFAKPVLRSPVNRSPLTIQVCSVRNAALALFFIIQIVVGKAAVEEVNGAVAQLVVER